MTARLRTFTVGELLDGAFSLYRRNFSSFFATALVPQLPLIALWLVLPVFAGAGAEGVVESTTALSLPYSGLAALLIWAALVFACMQGFEHGTVTAGEALKVGLRKMGPVIVASVVALFLIGSSVVPGGILMAVFFAIVPTIVVLLVVPLVVPGLILMAMFFAIVPAIVIENRGPFEALGRSRRLSKGARLRICGVIMLALLIAGLPVIAFSMIAGVAAAAGIAAAGQTPTMSVGWQALVQAGSLVLGALTTPYSVAAVTLLYVDRRARTEAPDLEEAAARLSGV